MISSDRNILVPNSAVSERMKEYGALVDELQIVLLSDHAHGLKEAQLGKNVWVYPTNSAASFLRPWDASRLGKKIVYDKKFVRGESLITADSIECGWAGTRVKSKWRLPLEVQLHSDPFSPYFSGFQNRVRKFFARRVLAGADSIRVVSESVAQKLKIENSKLKIYTLPIYVDQEKISGGQIVFDLHARYGWRFIMLAVTRLSPEKNLELTIEILAQVRDRFPDTGLVIVGSGPEERGLKSLVKKLNLAGSVEFVGWQNDLTSFYKTANVFIQTLVFEGYGLALVEAGLNGLPVITTPVGIAQELENGKDAYIFNIGDKEALAQGVCDLIENNFKRENLRLNLKSTLEKKLISKEEFLKRLREWWENTAKLV